MTFPPEIVRTLTPSDSKCEMSSEYASSVPKYFVNLCEGRSYGKGESINRDYRFLEKTADGFTILLPKIQVEPMDAI